MLKQILDYILVEERLDFFFLHLAWIFPLLCIFAGMMIILVKQLHFKALVSAFFIGLVGPLISLLWLIYNLITDYFGIDSVKGLLVNLAFFICTGLIIGMILRFAQQRFTRTIKSG